MVDAGIVDTQDAHVQTAMDVKLPLAARCAANAVITARYGEYFDSYTVEQLDSRKKKEARKSRPVSGNGAKRTGHNGAARKNSR